MLGAIALPLTGQIIIGNGDFATVDGEKTFARNIDSLSNAVCLITDFTLPEKFQNKSGFDNLVKNVKLVRTWGNCYGYVLLATGRAV